MTPVRVRLPTSLYDSIRSDLRRRHEFAAERVGFILASAVTSEEEGAILLAKEYDSIPDEHYVDDPDVGARIDARSIRSILQRVLSTGLGCFHVHAHRGRGVPRMSRTDREGIPPLIASMRALDPNGHHGIIVFSDDDSYVEIWTPSETEPTAQTKVVVVGAPLRFMGAYTSNQIAPEWLSRQSFLGDRGQLTIGKATVGIVGLGGGGSHVALQLAHVGISHFNLFDRQTIEHTNLNRLVGGTRDDAKRKVLKVTIASRSILGVNPDAHVDVFPCDWQDEPEALRGCDIVVGCVDSYQQRSEIEALCRRYLIPFVDIGMDVHIVPGEPPRMAGQVILSLPESPCMRCIGFLTDDRLAEEAARYGDAGPQPQVVWANGLLASAAVDAVVDLLTGWSGRSSRLYRSYDGNLGSLVEHPRLTYIRSAECQHYPLEEVGPPRWKQL